MAKPDKIKKKPKLKVNFEGVETRVLVPEGKHHTKVVAIDVEEGDKGQYLSWTFEVMSDDKTNGAKLFTNTSLAPQALWNLRSLLEALGVDTPDTEFDLDLEAYKELEVMLTVEHETYEGKTKARVTDYTAIEETAETEDDAEEESEEVEEEVEEEEEAEEVEEEDEPEEKPAKKGKVKKVTEDEVKEMDADELKDLCKKHGLKVKLDGMRASKQVAAVIDALEKADLLAD